MGKKRRKKGRVENRELETAQILMQPSEKNAVSLLFGERCRIDPIKAWHNYLLGYRPGRGGADRQTDEKTQASIAQTSVSVSPIYRSLKPRKADRTPWNILSL